MYHEPHLLQSTQNAVLDDKPSGSVKVQMLHNTPSFPHQHPEEGRIPILASELDISSSWVKLGTLTSVSCLLDVTFAFPLPRLRPLPRPFPLPLSCFSLFLRSFSSLMRFLSSFFFFISSSASSFLRLSSLSLSTLLLRSSTVTSPIFYLYIAKLSTQRD